MLDATNQRPLRPLTGDKFKSTRTSSLVDELLNDIYEQLHKYEWNSNNSKRYAISKRHGSVSSTSFATQEHGSLSRSTSTSTGTGSSTPTDLISFTFAEDVSTNLKDDPLKAFQKTDRKSLLRSKQKEELVGLITSMRMDIENMSTILIKALKKKDKLQLDQVNYFDIITAALQAISNKTHQDSKLKFSLDPNNSSCDSSRAGSFDNDEGDKDENGDKTGNGKGKKKRKESAGFTEWQDAMRMVVRLPGGIPTEFRKKLWMTLSERYIKSKKINWNQTVRICFNDKLNPDDDSIGEQIIKDLHRTGCSLFSGDEAEHNQALLKQVLLAYARWNKNVGYCQGFNILAAVILEVVEWDVEESLMVMIYLIEGVLPESYFANNLRGLTVDMAVFRDLMRIRLPVLSKHLDMLQYSPASGANPNDNIACYEPPLINVFTLQWFLTLFCNCLPKPLVLRIWDLIFLEGNEVLIRTALSIWDVLTERILAVKSADEFYSIMGVLTREMMEFGLSDTNELVKNVCIMAPFPLPRLFELREKYTYNIRPLSNNSFSFVKKGLSLFTSSEDEEDDDSIKLPDDQLTVATWGLAEQYRDVRTPSPILSRETSVSSPGGVDPQRMSLDVSLLKKQYSKLRERQKQAHVIITEGFKYAHDTAFSSRKGPPPEPTVPINKLLAGKPALISLKPKRTSSVQLPVSGSGNKISSSSSQRKASKSGSTKSGSSNSERSNRANRSSPSKRSERIKRTENVNDDSDDDNARLMNTKSETKDDKVGVVKVKRAPFQPILKTRSKIGRRASSIDPAQDGGGETLSWSEIRKRRKASAPLIKVILKQGPDSPLDANKGTPLAGTPLNASPLLGTPTTQTPTKDGSQTPKDGSGSQTPKVIEIEKEIYEKQKRLIDLINNEDNNNFNLNFDEDSSTEDEQDADIDDEDDDYADDDDDAKEVDVNEDAKDGNVNNSDLIEIIKSAEKSLAADDVDVADDVEEDAKDLDEDTKDVEEEDEDKLSVSEKLSVWTDMTPEADKSFALSTDTEFCDANTDSDASCATPTQIRSASPDKLTPTSSSPIKRVKSPKDTVTDANPRLEVVHEVDDGSSAEDDDEKDEQTLITVTFDGDANLASPRRASIIDEAIKNGLTPIEEEGPSTEDAFKDVSEDANFKLSSVDANIEIPEISVSYEEIDEEQITENIKREVSELSIDEMIKRFNERLSSVNTD